jgi:hypothetical protein
MLEAAVVAEWSFVGAAGGAHPLSTAKAAAAAVMLRTVMHSTDTKMWGVMRLGYV